jgi:hypothetical protein
MDLLESVSKNFDLNFVMSPQQTNNSFCILTGSKFNLFMFVSLGSAVLCLVLYFCCVHFERIYHYFILYLYLDRFYIL